MDRFELSDELSISHPHLIIAAEKLTDRQAVSSICGIAKRRECIAFGESVKVNTNDNDVVVEIIPRLKFPCRTCPILTRLN